MDLATIPNHDEKEVDEEIEVSLEDEEEGLIKDLGL